MTGLDPDPRFTQTGPVERTTCLIVDGAGAPLNYPPRSTEAAENYVRHLNRKRTADGPFRVVRVRYAWPMSKPAAEARHG